MPAIETSVAVISVLEENILRIEFKPDCYIDIREFEENLCAYKKLMTTEKVYVLTIASPGATISREARDRFSSPERSTFKIAEAFVIESLAHKILADFVTRVQKPKHRLRFFNTEEKAMKWLKKLMKETKKEKNQ
jgi:hypothetical protein